MGKQSRMKRERQAAPAKPVNIVANLYRGQDEDAIRNGYQELADALKLEHKMVAIERANNAPLGDPENAHKIDLTFNPVNALIDQIEGTGDIDVNSKGYPLFYDKGDKCWYPLVPGLTSMCDTFAQLSREFHWIDQTTGLRKLAKKLDVQMPLFQADIDGARASDIGGEYAEGYPDVTDEAKADLDNFLKEWIEKHTNPGFYTVSNARPYILSADDFESSEVTA